MPLGDPTGYGDQSDVLQALLLQRLGQMRERPPVQQGDLFAQALLANQPKFNPEFDPGPMGQVMNALLPVVAARSQSRAAAEEAQTNRLLEEIKIVTVLSDLQKRGVDIRKAAREAEIEESILTQYGLIGGEGEAAAGSAGKPGTLPEGATLKVGPLTLKGPAATKPGTSLDSILAERVRAGEMTLEDAMAAKRKGGIGSEIRAGFSALGQQMGGGIAEVARANQAMARATASGEYIVPGTGQVITGPQVKAQQAARSRMQTSDQLVETVDTMTKLAQEAGARGLGVAGDMRTIVSGLGSQATDAFGAAFNQAQSDMNELASEGDALTGKPFKSQTTKNVFAALRNPSGDKVRGLQALLTYQVAGSLAGQEGRGLSDADFENAENMIGRWWTATPETLTAMGEQIKQQAFRARMRSLQDITRTFDPSGKVTFGPTSARELQLNPLTMTPSNALEFLDQYYQASEGSNWTKLSNLDKAARLRADLESYGFPVGQ